SGPQRSSMRISNSAMDKVAVYRQSGADRRLDESLHVGIGAAARDGRPPSRRHRDRQSPAAPAIHIPGMGLPIRELKKRKKLEPTSTAVPAASAASICREDVIPALPSGIGQSLGSRMRTGLTSHQMGLAFTRLLSTT